MTTIALLAWPLVTLVLVLRLPFAKAVLISVLGGFLLLPVEGGIDLPLLPAFEKDTIPALSLLVLALLLHRGSNQQSASLSSDLSFDMPGWVPRSVIGATGLLMIVLGAMMTALTNDDQLIYGPTVLPGLRSYDGFSLALYGMMICLPLILGRKFFAHPERHALLLQGLILGALAYSLLVLYEIRMSPQLSSMIYGFFPHEWNQHFRGGGYRPVVFMEHGLQLTIFLSAVTLAAFGASRCLEAHRRGFYLFAGTWLLGTLVLSNSLGALIIAIVFLPAVLFLGIRMQLLFAAVIAGIILVYPMLRGVDLIPTERLVAMADAIEPERAKSLNFRFRNEDILLSHARERPFFGWGPWNRNRVFNESGQDITVTDGAWVIIMGVRGWVGYLAQFGLLTLPVIVLAFNRRRYEVSPVTAVLALVLVASLVDLIPNGFLSPITFLLAGALWGRLELRTKVETVNEEPIGEFDYAHKSVVTKVAAKRHDGLPYTRQTTRNHRDRKSY